LKFRVSGQDVMMNCCDNGHKRVCVSHGSDTQKLPVSDVWRPVVW
jgi:hypothetical protein